MNRTKLLRYVMLVLLLLPGALAVPRLAVAGNLALNVPDPATDWVYPSAVSEEYELAPGAAGVVWHPDIPEIPSNTPVFLLRHGNGQHIEDYHYLLEHLARNAFIAASVEGTAEQMLDHIGYLIDTFGLDEDVKVAMLGHSKGGAWTVEAVLENAALGRPYNIHTVIGLAPSDQDRFHVTEDAARAYLAIYGSTDEDTTGWNDDSSAEPPTPATARSGTAAFGAYDRAGSEESTDGDLVTTLPMTRSMVFVYGADHNSWRDPAPYAPGYIGPAAHRAILKAYVTGFVNWQIHGEKVYRGMFTGGWKPQSVRYLVTKDPDGWGNPAGSPVQLFTQFSEAKRRVLAHFESPVAYEAVGVTHAVGASHLLNCHSPHDTGALLVSWTGVPISYIRFPMPEAFAYRDVREFDVLSFRVGQTYDPSCGRDHHCEGPNPFGEDQDFLVGIEDEDGRVLGVRASDFGRIPYPDYFYLQPGFPGQEGDHSKSAMRTIRIPLQIFKGRGIDLAKVRSVIFQFDGDRGSSGELLFDSIEFCD